MRRLIFLFASVCSFALVSVALVQCGSSDDGASAASDASTADVAPGSEGGFADASGSLPDSAPDPDAAPLCPLSDAGAPGTLDPKFANGHVAFPKAGAPFQTKTAVLDNSGRLYIVGAAQGCIGTDTDFAVMRLDAKGALDRTFALGAGFRCYDFGSNDIPEVAIVDDQNRVVIGGSSSTNAAVFRITPTGDPDAFGTAGLVTLPFASGAPAPTVYGLTSGPDGIVVSGGDHDALTDSTNGYVVRLLDSGNVDPAFSAYATDKVFGFRGGHVRSPNGNVILLATLRNATSDWALIVLSQSGVEVHAPTMGTTPSAGGASARASGILFSPMELGETQSYYLVAGSLGGSGALLMRLGDDDTPSAKFGTAGQLPLTLTIDPARELRSLVRQCDGRALVLGYGGTPRRSVIMRFTETTGAPDTAYGNGGAFIVPLSLPDAGGAADAGDSGGSTDAGDAGDGGGSTDAGEAGDAGIIVDAVGNAALLIDPSSGKVLVVSGSSGNDGAWVSRVLP